MQLLVDRFESGIAHLATNYTTISSCCLVNIIKTFSSLAHNNALGSSLKASGRVGGAVTLRGIARKDKLEFQPLT